MRQSGFLSFSNIPMVTKNVIIINVILWLATWIMQDKVDLVHLLGLHFPGVRDFYVFQFFTYMFMHANLAHLFFNMFAVYMFGQTLEQVWGPRRFLIYYVVTGMGAAIIQLLTWLIIIMAVATENGMTVTDQLAADPSANMIVTVGASGAVFGILLAFAMYFPNVKMYIIPIPYPIKAKYLVAAYGLIELFAGVAHFTGDNVAHFAHLGGMLFGVGFVLYWKNKDKFNDEYFY